MLLARLTVRSKGDLGISAWLRPDFKTLRAKSVILMINGQSRLRPRRGNLM